MPALPYHPQPGEVVWCDYRNLIAPEMEKKRLAIVVSPRFRSRGPLCAVVPISTTKPDNLMFYHHRLEADPMPDSPEGTIAWAKCDMIMTVSFERLSGWHEFVDSKRVYRKLMISNNDLKSVRKAILCGLGMSNLTPHME